MSDVFDDLKCRELLSSLPGWEIADGQLTKVFRFKSYPECLEFAQSCGGIAEEMNHHPDLLVQWGKVTVTIMTHSCDALTALDFDYANRLEVL